MLNTILAAIWGYLTSLWGIARIAFSSLNTTLMTSCLEVLAVVFLISIIDGLPDLLKRRKPTEDPKFMKQIQTLIAELEK